MSGGSFNYVSVTDVDGPSSDHEEIVDALAEYPGSAAVVAEARAVLAKWREVVDAWANLTPVMKAVEWTQSGDWGPDSVAEAIRVHKPT